VDKGIDRVGFSVPRAGIDNNYGILHRLFQQAVYPGPIQIDLISRSYRHITMKKPFRHVLPLPTGGKAL
jgi:hypothetical protein